MIVFNLTDVPTDTLKVNGFVNVSITVDGVAIKPGASVNVSRARYSEISRYVSAGALSLFSAPADYLAAKAAMAVEPEAVVGVAPIEEPAAEELTVEVVVNALRQLDSGSDKKRRK